MATTLNNTAILNGQYGGEAFDPQQASVATAIVDMTITKSADPTVWIGDGNLTYTVNVSNNDTDLPLTNLVLTDTLDPALITYVDGSAEINGVAIPADDITYDDTSGLLTIQLPDIPATEARDITFRVAKK